MQSAVDEFACQVVGGRRTAPCPEVLTDPDPDRLFLIIKRTDRKLKFLPTYTRWLVLKELGSASGAAAW